MMPENEIRHAETIKRKMSAENSQRTRVAVASISMKYKAAKNAMIAGSLDKSAFEKVHKLTSRAIAGARAEFRSRQRDIQDTWNLHLKRQAVAEATVGSDLQKINEVFEETLASLADRYGKRIAYFQSLPIVKNHYRCYKSGNWDDATLPASCNEVQQKTAVCPIYEDGTAERIWKGP